MRAVRGALDSRKEFAIGDGEIGVADHGIGVETFGRIDLDARHGTAGPAQDARDRGVVADVHTRIDQRPGEPGRHHVHATLGHEDALDGVHVRDHGIDRQCLVRSEPGVHRLEAEDLLQALVVEERSHLLVEFAEPTELHEFEPRPPRLDQVERRVEVGVDERVHLGPIQLLQPVTEMTERLGLLGVGELADLLCHRLAAMTDEQRRAVGVHGPVHRVDRVDGDVVLHLGAARVERSFEQVRHREHGGAVVESEPVRHDHSGAPARNRVALDDRHFVARLDEVGRSGEPSQAGTDDDDPHQTFRQLT